MSYSHPIAPQFPGLAQLGSYKLSGCLQRGLDMSPILPFVGILAEKNQGDCRRLPIVLTLGLRFRTGESSQEAFRPAAHGLGQGWRRLLMRLLNVYLKGGDSLLCQRSVGGAPLQQSWARSMAVLSLSFHTVVQPLIIH